ncbi:5'-methylthioadenosine/S-adenosylhomocysteine nucleosidase [Mycobacterium gallinarum]|uniref:adenosylhomocysteine nucleosidase n=1 Tax=Mycobacterium gallinarum TaxID=39689 RepID=A0A9W4B1E3_9MYCO|nr:MULTISPECIES: 5'-methylthioadenosine/adenosylhomocysteine nucleosidase [Mycobacterium]MDV3135500.1 5'-methylthioadenosine/adenosylhomocysteine nucleosidase [Mycobacterium sp. 29Ha]BBY92269.1 5'-methylthioadenosine/S-adenosylhomocysteine nucleosidase [Mycobacterium gallinarum]
MTIGLICAIPQELDALLGDLSETHSEARAHTRFVTGVLDGHDVVLAGSGMGKVNAAIVTTLLADRFGCRTIVFSGVAGGLDPALSIGDVVVADRIVQHDAGVLENEKIRPYQPGHAPIINETDRLGYPVDPELLGRVKGRLADMAVPGQIVYGTVLTGDQYLNCDSTREWLLAEFGGKAIEMEGGAVAQVCEAFGLPWLVIRALSDLAGGNSLFDFTAFVDQASATSATILRHLLPVL